MNLTYTGSLVQGSVLNDPFQAYGNFTPNDMDTWNPVYNLYLDVGFIIHSNYWILANFYDSSGVLGGIITYSCIAGASGGSADAQLFFLSRYPSFYSTITYDAMKDAAIAQLTRRTSTPWI